ncbi:equilibrative nucleobase transporter 1-like isoform X1 [Mytilus edulis]|uniref:equilibrative nucleobase transporter 1-like isoform X1 n=1 Tax=Mytilus edulis TaxID=6550 RepID=UPI0039EEA986
MACYRKFRGLCTVWCSVEILLFSGIIYGWSSLVFIFTNEGFYADLCKKNQLITDVEINFTHGENVSGIYSGDHRNNITFFDSNDEEYKDCTEQESRLGLFFSIGVGFTWAGMAILGPMTKALGTRITRIVILLVYEIGLFCLAFTTTETSWLICPGLCCIGVAGLAHFASNIQVANLFQGFSSTIVALFCGLFDSSSVILQVVKIAYGLGIGRRESFLFLACLYLVMIGTSTFFILPKCYITSNEKLDEVEICVTSDSGLQYTEIQRTDKPSMVTKTNPKKGVLSYMKSMTYISHVCWMTIHCLLFSTFLNLLYIRIDKLANGEVSTVSYYVGVFAYTTMGSGIGSVVAGLIYDAERRRYSDFSKTEKKWKPVVIPMTACGIFIAAVFSFLLVENISFLFPSFVLFTLFRNFLFSIGVAFVNEAFPSEYFGPLYGFMTFINGVFSLTQYGLVKWAVSSQSRCKQVYIALIIMASITFLHPLQLWIRSNKMKKLPQLTHKSDEAVPLQDKA